MLIVNKNKINVHSSMYKWKDRLCRCIYVHVYKVHVQPMAISDW